MTTTEDVPDSVVATERPDAYTEVGTTADGEIWLYAEDGDHNTGFVGLRFSAEEATELAYQLLHYARRCD